jgi:hypothetical protein
VLISTLLSLRVRRQAYGLQAPDKSRGWWHSNVRPHSVSGAGAFAQLPSDTTYKQCQADHGRSWNESRQLTESA